ncbi:MAG: hypothetical protein WCZ70_02595 [Sulfurimonadaceae bacterium]
MSIEDTKDNKKIKNIDDLKQLDNSGGILLSPKSNEAIKLIKNKLRKTAETIIEIGELLIEAIDGKESIDYKKEFYKQLGMSERSGQRYMQIAKSEIIQKLKIEKPKQLEHMTMSDLLYEINDKKKTDNNGKDKPKIEASKRAKNIYKQYKNDPKTLEEIINNLQDMLKKQQNDIVIDAQ